MSKTWDSLLVEFVDAEGGSEARGIVRKVMDPERGPDGLFVQPHDVGPDRERDEQHNRDRFASHFKYADPFTGNTRTFDDEGRYNCGRCNQAEGVDCLLLDMDRIDREAGSCGDWEVTCAGDAEMLLQLKSTTVASYSIAENGVGWGCHRCPFASEAHQPDSRGRQLYCGKMDARVFWNACCAINGAKSVPIDDRGNPKHERSTMGAGNVMSMLVPMERLTRRGRRT